MLAVIEHHQQIARAQDPGEGGGERFGWGLAHAERTGNGLWDEGLVRQGRQLNQPDAVRVVVQNGSCHLERQPRFAAATHPRQRHQACPGEQCLHLGQLLLAADEAAERGRQVVAPIRCGRGGPLAEGALFAWHSQKPFPGTHHYTSSGMVRSSEPISLIDRLNYSAR